MTAPEKIVKRVESFKANYDEYMSGVFNETQTRVSFINPLFEALGWDVRNEESRAETYREVVHEESIEVGRGLKAPDMTFRIGGIRKFFVECKKPSVDLKEETHPAYQLRRYGWSAKLPLSILTDFEEFAVYDCRIKPKKSDKASVALIKYYKFEDYINQWDEIAALFSREAVLTGAFDRYAVKVRKRGTAEVDDAFLEEIERWREVLAKSIALKNRGLTDRELNYAVQQTIDRIIFLRICEDRGIEPYQALAAVSNGANVYDRLKQLFVKADQRFNSGLFHFNLERERNAPPDELTPRIKINDEVLKEIIASLYYPNPYEFSVFPADILGQVYERFLGKIIRLTAGHQAKVEEKPEVRKAGGVYYTPTYIVDYIVKNTVGKLLEGKTPNKVEKLRILDPACGSGSFLIGAYQHLLDWHLKWYLDQGPAKHKKAMYQVKKDEWRLTTAERKRILLNNIYGVDIDTQAVEVTKLSLLLKVLEGENKQTLDKQMKLFHERALPDLESNIKCGNSLIGPDYHEGIQLTLLGDENQTKINAFDWNHEFRAIIAAGGFDAVIGNPPYIRMESFKIIKNYLQSHYETHAERADIFFYFVEKSASLLKMDGRLGFILSNTFTRSESGTSLRRFINRKFLIQELVEFGDFLPFEGATVYPIITILERTNSAKRKGKVHFILQDSAPGGSADTFNLPMELDTKRFSERAWTFEDDRSRELRERLMSDFPSLKSIYGSVNMGIKTGLNEAFIIDANTRKRIIAKNKRAKEIIKPYLGGRNLDRWYVKSDNLYLLYTSHGLDMRAYPAVVAHLEPFKGELLKRATKQEWYELQQPQHAYQNIIDGPKIIYPDMSRYPKFSLDRTGAYFSNTVYFIPSDSLYLLGLLNSKLLWFVIRGLSNALRGGLWRFRLFSGHIERLPIWKPNMSKKSDINAHNSIVNFAKQQIKLHEQLFASKTPHEQTALRRHIAANDRQIDFLVYELYGLTKEEIRIVEGTEAKI